MNNSTDSSVIVITGASAGIGAAAARALSAQGWQVHGTGRSKVKLDAVAAACGAGFTGHICDFASFAAVRELGATLAALPRIDVLANNAGGTWPAKQLTEDGHELTIQANHLSPFLLTELLRSKLEGGRVIDTASVGHRFAQLRVDDLDWADRTYRESRVYGTTKLCNVLHAAELQRRWGGTVFSASYHPGAVRSEFGRDSKLVAWASKSPIGALYRSNEQGADTMIHLATAPLTELVPGAYYVRRKVHTASGPGRSASLAAQLWDTSAKIVGV